MHCFGSWRHDSFEYDLCCVARFIWIVNLLPWDNLEWNEVITFIAHNNASQRMFLLKFFGRLMLFFCFVSLSLSLVLASHCNDARPQIHKSARRRRRRLDIICRFFDMTKNENIKTMNTRMEWIPRFSVMTILGAKLNWWGRSKPYTHRIHRSSSFGG